MTMETENEPITREDVAAYPKLSREQMVAILPRGVRREYSDSEPIIDSGQRAYPFYIVDSGHVEITDDSWGTHQKIVRHESRKLCWRH